MQGAILQGLARAFPLKAIFDADAPFEFDTFYSLDDDDFDQFYDVLTLWMTANSNFPTSDQFGNFLFPEATDAPPDLALLTPDHFDAVLPDGRSFAVQTGPNRVQILFRDPNGNVVQRDPLDMPLILVEVFDTGEQLKMTWNDDRQTYEAVTPSRPEAFENDGFVFLFVLSPGGGGDWVLTTADDINFGIGHDVREKIESFFGERNSRDYTNVAHYLSESDFVGALRYVIDMQVDTGVLLSYIFNKAARAPRFRRSNPDFAFMNNLATFVAILFPIYYDDDGFKRAMANAQNRAMWDRSLFGLWVKNNFLPRLEAAMVTYASPQLLESLSRYQRLGLAREFAEDATRQAFEERNEGYDSGDDSGDGSCDVDGSRKRTSSMSGASDRKRQKR